MGRFSGNMKIHISSVFSYGPCKYKIHVIVPSPQEGNIEEKDRNKKGNEENPLLSLHC